ncbi:MAG: hypothetical protein AB8F95_18045, partial [Bacteroidia bacterium]
GQTALVDFRQEIEGRLQRLEERIINQHNETLELIKTVKAEKADRQSLSDMLVQLGESLKS